MATEHWLKVRKALLRSPKIHILSAELNISLGEAFYTACLWLDYLDEYTEKGVTNVTPQFLESYFSCPSLFNALKKIGWVDVNKEGHVFALEYDKHNGQNVKKKLQDAERKAKSRAEKCHKNVTKKSQECHKVVTKLSQTCHKNVTEKSHLEKEKKKQKEKEYIYIYNNKGGEYKEGSFNSAPAPQTLAAPAAPPPFEKKSIFRSPDERAAYKAWLAQVKAAHPAGREMQEMGAKLHGTALAAFRAVPQAGEHGELLAAFYSSSIDTSTNGKPFKRPNEFIWYLTDLADVLVAAKRWQKETRWKPKSATPAQLPPPPAPQAEEMTEEEKQSFFSAMRPNRHHQQNAPECA